MLNHHKIKRTLHKLRHRIRYHKDGTPRDLSATKLLTLSGITIVGLGVLSVLGFFTAIAILSIGLPDVNDLDSLSVPQSTTIYDREGNPLYVKFGEENREYVTIKQMSPHIIDATLAIEDEKFYEHPGFDMLGVMRAIINNATGGPTQGASTITQQYIKLTFLTSEKSYTRKIKELILAVRLEQAFDKDTILEKYLNKIPYGNNAFGVEKAAQTYFDKSAKDLTLAESAILAGMPQAPSYYNPYGPHQYTQLSGSITVEELQKRNIDEESDLNANQIERGLLGTTISINDTTELYLQGRTDLVLKRMEEVGLITEQEMQSAILETKTLAFAELKQSIKAPHFVFFVIEQLENKYGAEIVEQGGLKVYTTIDPQMQEIAENVISERAEANEANYNVKNASLVTMNPNSGEILAMVGSRDYFDNEIDGQTNIATSFRQPGSSFKPFVFAKLFENRYTPASVIFDVPTPFGADRPQNYDGSYKGPMNIRQALAQSRNIPAIKAFFLAGGQKDIMPLAKAMGIVYRDETLEYGYPYALGTAETTLLSLTNAYGTFANGGYHFDPVSILRVENAQGEILDEWTNKPGDQVLDPQITYLITSILSDTDVRLGPNLTVNGQVNAAKTGTSNIRQGSTQLPNDLLTVGYTTDLVTAVWAGNNDSRKDGYLAGSASGYTVAAPIFKAFMDQALADSPSSEFPIPEGIKKETVSRTNGLLASDITPEDQQYEEFFASFSVPTELDDSYQDIPNFNAAEKLSNVICENGQKQHSFKVVYHDIDPERELWENAAQEWLKENREDFQIESSSVGCSEAEENVKLSITSPDNNQVIRSNEIEVDINSSSNNGIKVAHFYLDNDLKYKQDIAPFTGTIRLPRGASKDTYTITVRVFDQAGNIGEDSITIRTTTQSNDDAEEN